VEVKFSAVLHDVIMCLYIFIVFVTLNPCIHHFALLHI